MGKSKNNKLPADWDAIKAFWLQSGKDYKATGKAFGIRPNTILQHGKRHDWPSVSNLVRKIETTKKELQVVAGESVTLSPSVATERHLEDQKKAFHSSMAIGLTNAASCLTELDNMSALEASRKMVDLANAGKTIFGIGAESDRPVLSVNVLQAGLQDFVLPQVSRQ